MAQDALILIDIQNDYFPGGKMELDGMDAAAANAHRVLESFRRRNRPVFHVQHLSDRPGATFFLPDTTGADIHASVAPTAGEPVIQKHFPNAFRDTPLRQKLADATIGRLTICGAMTHMCIDTSVRAAFDLGFTCRVVADACATRSLDFGGNIVTAAQVQAAFMAALGAAFARIVTTDDFLSPSA
jgi:nicotinamidase-related amidase